MFLTSWDRFKISYEKNGVGDNLAMYDGISRGTMEFRPRELDLKPAVEIEKSYHKVVSGCSNVL